MGAAEQKPTRPKNFPLYAHASKRWAKKIRGKTHFFGHWREPEKALAKFYTQYEDLKAGRIPRVQREGVTIADIVNEFLAVKEGMRDAGELSPRSFHDYYSTCAEVVGYFGRSRLVSDLVPGDFDKFRAVLKKGAPSRRKGKGPKPQGRGPVALGNEIQRVKILFKFAYDTDLIDKPIKFGTTFKKPSKKVLRGARNARGSRMFEAADIRAMLNHEKTSPQMKAMILLGVQAGIGNHDIAMLPVKALDLDRAWLDYPRNKTEIERRVPLWVETVQALRVVLTERKEPKSPEDQGVLFLTRTGQRWVRLRPKGVWVDSIGVEFRKILIALNLKRDHLGFYGLRRGFETVGGESIDQVAVDAIMGHAANSDDMSAVYRERISDERLIAVVETIRRWLWPGGSEAAWLKAEAKRRKAETKKAATST